MIKIVLGIIITVIVAITISDVGNEALVLELFLEL